MPFLNNCQDQCVATGAVTTYCSRVCECVVAQAQSTDLWKKMLASEPDDAAEQRFRAVTQQCAREERPKDDSDGPQ